MSVLLLLVGGIILVFVYSDFVYTALSTNGSGIISSWLTGNIWNLLLQISRKLNHRRLLNYASIFCLLSLLSTWILLAWLGNALIFCSDADSVRHITSQRPATTVEKFYYAGYTLSTMGNGDFYATTAIWKLFTVVVSLSGLSLLTVAITYLVQVLTSEIEKKRLSLYIAALGHTPQEILLNGWDGQTFKALEPHLPQLTAMILSHSQHHLAYPVLHYFHSPHPSESTALMLTALDEAISILLLYVPESNRPDELAIRSLRRALTNYLQTLEDDFIETSGEPLPLPAIDRLSAKGLPVFGHGRETVGQWAQLARRRKLWRTIIEKDGWNWHDLNERVSEVEGMDVAFSGSKQTE